MIVESVAGDEDEIHSVFGSFLAELLERGGYYAELHRRQLLEEELAVSE